MYSYFTQGVNPQRRIWILTNMVVPKEDIHRTDKRDFRPLDGHDHESGWDNVVKKT